MQQDERKCGSCTACCKTHLVSEISKPAGRWCKYCTPGKGCGIYATRPEPCRLFKCEWLKGFGEENERPDRVKCVLDFITRAVDPEVPETGLLQIWEAMEGALGHRYVREITEFISSKNIWVTHLYLSGRKKLFLPQNQQMTTEIRRLMEAEEFELGLL